MNNRLHRLLWTGLLAAMLAACQTAPKPINEPVMDKAAMAELALAAEAAALAAAQAQAPVDPVAEREQALSKALETYADGRYEEAIAELTPLIAAPELSLSAQVKVHKFMAFSHCVLTRLKQCRQSFDLALEQDPTFQLTEAERGHPVWGREFRSARAALRKRPSK